MRIISGGQTGVDQAALRAAQDGGLACGGWCPPGRVCESGIIPSRFPLQETPRDRSPEAPEIPRSQRSEWNVCNSDATLILAHANAVENDAGTDWTMRCAERYRRPVMICDPAHADSAAAILRWLRQVTPATLNIAGPSERAAPGIGRRVYSLLTRVFARLQTSASDAGAFGHERPQQRPDSS
jgi:hypothetical protein